MAVLEITGNAFAPIESSELETRGAEQPVVVVEDAALKLVVQDAALAEQWLGQKQWGMYWQESDILYQSPRSLTPWEGSGGNVTRASVSRFTVAKHVNSLVPTMMSGIFYDSPPFVLRPRPGTTQASTRAWTALVAALLERMEFKLNLEPGVESQVLNGTGIFKGGCFTECKTEKRFKRKAAPSEVQLPFDRKREVPTVESDELDVVERETKEWVPFFEHRPLGQILVAPGWRHSNRIHLAPYIIDRTFPTFKDLEKLRKQDNYTIPSEAELKALFFPPTETTKPIGMTEQSLTNPVVHHAARRDEKQSADPLLMPMKMDERWDGDRVITVLQDKLVIRNEEHGMGRMPFWAANYWNIQNAGYGLGVGRLIGTEQRIDVGSTNAALDILAYGVNPQYAVSDGANVQTQALRSRLGGIVKVQGDVGKGIGLVETPEVPADVWRVIEASKQASESTTGADEAAVQGVAPGRGSSMMRTATGAGIPAAAAATRIQGPVGRLVDGVLIPYIYFLIEMVKERMPTSQIRAILKDVMEESFELDLEDFMNAKLNIEVLAGAHLAAKKAMAQSLPFLIQIFENQHLTQQLNATGWVVDVQELFDMLMEVSEWKNQRQVIRKMNPQEMEMFKALNPQLAAMMTKMKELDAKHKNAMEEIDQKTEGRMAGKVLEKALDGGQPSAFDKAAEIEDRQTSERALEVNQPQARQTPQFTTAAR